MRTPIINENSTSATAALISAAFLAYCGLVAAGSLRAFRRRMEPTLAFTIGMRDFATLFEFLADVKETLRFGEGALRSDIFASCRNHAVVRLHDSDDQPASGNFGARLRYLL